MDDLAAFRAAAAAAGDFKRVEVGVVALLDALPFLAEEEEEEEEGFLPALALALASASLRITKGSR